MHTDFFYLHYEDARREARKAFLALAEKGGAQPLDLNLEEDELEDVIDAPTNDDSQLSKSVPVGCLSLTYDIK